MDASFEVMQQIFPSAYGPSLRSILQSPPIYDIIFQCLSPCDLIHVSQTSKNAYTAIYHYLARAFSVNRLLARFFKDPCAFRSLQAHTGALISGSQALQFFSRTFWAGSDLDLYTHYEKSLEVGKWLESQGYRFVPCSKQPSIFSDAATPGGFLNQEDVFWDPQNIVDMKHEELYNILGVHSVFTFEKQCGLDILKVQIVEGYYSPLGVIVDFHSTAVMNFISWNKAYCLYPYATLQKSRSLVCFVPESPSPRYDRAMVKYHNRGFTMVTDTYPHEDPRCAFHLGVRFVGDNRSWVISLDTNGVVGPDISSDFDAYLICGWDVKKSSSRLHRRDRANAFEMETIGQGKFEHSKLTPEETAAYAGRRKPKPGFWKFYDEELAEMLREWIRAGQSKVSVE